LTNVTVTRTAKLEKPMGFGQGRISEGVINANFGSARTITANDVGLRSISNIIVSPGTPLDITVVGRVVSAGSIGNSARIRGYLRNTGTVASLLSVKTYGVYHNAFTGTPTLIVSPGSCTAKTAPGTPPLTVNRHTRGSFGARASPGQFNVYYVAVGPGSFPVNYVAVGD